LAVHELNGEKRWVDLARQHSAIVPRLAALESTAARSAAEDFFDGRIIN
jgi:hypothetical protein